MAEDEIEAEPTDPAFTAAQIELFDQARRGMDMEEMRSHPFVRFLLSEAAGVSQGAISALIDADPLDTRRIVELQAKARYAEDIGGWINQTIERGRAAIEQLEDSEQT